MKQLFCIIFIKLILVFVSSAQIFNATEEKPKSDTLAPAIIDIIPKNINVEKPDGQFIVKEVKVLNRGAQPLYLKKINTSCKCASGKVLTNPVYPMSLGKIELSVNLDGLSEDYNSIEFVIESSAKNSPTSVRLNVITKKNDSLKTDIK